MVQIHEVLSGLDLSALIPHPFQATPSPSPTCKLYGMPAVRRAETHTHTHTHTNTQAHINIHTQFLITWDVYYDDEAAGAK